MLEDAILLATQAHKWQKRKSGEDYIAHPLAVMEILRGYWFSEEALVAAVLHDICEDTDVSNFEIREKFWDRVWFIINALTKNKKPRNNDELKKRYEEIKKQTSKYKTIEEYMDYRFHLYINRFSVGIMVDPWIMFIKMADQIHNISTMWSFRQDKKIRKLKELEKYFIPVYQKMEYIVTPMYQKKYEWLLDDLIQSIETAKAA